MKHILLAMMLGAFAAPCYPMTATIPPATSANTPVAHGTNANAAAADTAKSATAATERPAPSAASVTRPVAALSAPGVPPKATPATSRSGAAPSKATVFMPGASSQSGVMAPPLGSAGWTQTARQGSDLRRGTLEAVNVNPGTFKVFGQKHNFNPQQVKVFTRDGRASNVYALKSGAKVRFTLDPKDPAQRRVAVIYVD